MSGHSSASHLSETPIQKAVRLMGGPSEAARKINCTQGFVSQLTRGDRPVPPKRAVQIEVVLEGAVTRQDLCPDFPWDESVA